MFGIVLATLAPAQAQAVLIVGAPQPVLFAVPGPPSADAELQVVAAELAGTGEFASIDVVDGGATTPTLADLQDHNAVLLFSDPEPGDPTPGFASSETLGDELADYVELG